MPHFLKQNIFEIQQCNLVSALSGSFVEEERGETFLKKAKLRTPSK